MCLKADKKMTRDDKRRKNDNKSRLNEAGRNGNQPN